MIQIEIDADLNWVDDRDRNIARLPANPSRFEVRGVAVAGRPGLSSWAVIDEIDAADGWIYFHQIDADGAAERAQLVIPADI